MHCIYRIKNIVIGICFNGIFNREGTFSVCIHMTALPLIFALFESFDSNHLSSVIIDILATLRVVS